MQLLCFLSGFEVSDTLLFTGIGTTRTDYGCGSS